MQTPSAAQEIIPMLEQSRESLHAAAAGLSDQQASIRPAPDRWSVIEIIEHVARAEESFAKWLERAEVRDMPTVDREKEATLAVQLADRSKKVEAPDVVKPQGKCADLASALEYFDAARAHTIEFARSQGERLYHLHTAHPRRGPVNGAELLVIAAGHARRHAEQVREVIAAIAAR